MTYSYSPNYNLHPLGVFQPKLVFPPSGPVRFQWSGDTGPSHFFSVVKGARDGGNCLQVFLPKGDLGAGAGIAGYGSSEIQLHCDPAAVLHVRFGHKFNSGFDFHSQGKIPMRVDNGGGGLRNMWNAKSIFATQTLCHSRQYWGSLTAVPGEGHYGEIATPWDYVAGQWYDYHFIVAPGPQGYGEIWIKRPSDAAEVRYFRFGPLPFTDPAAVFSVWLSSFFGGGGSAQASLVPTTQLFEGPFISTSAVAVQPPPVVVPPPLPVADSSQVVLDANGVLTVNFLSAGAVIPPPSQYAFTSSDPAIAIGPPVALNAAPLLPAGGIAGTATITVTCAGITGGTATFMAKLETKVAPA